MKKGKRLFITLLILTTILSSTKVLAKDDSNHGSINLESKDYKIYKVLENGEITPSGYDDELNGYYVFEKRIRVDSKYSAFLRATAYLSYGSISKIEEVHLATPGGKGFSGTVTVKKTSSKYMWYNIDGAIYDSTTTTITSTSGVSAGVEASFSVSSTSSFYHDIFTTGQMSIYDRIQWK